MKMNFKISENACQILISRLNNTDIANPYTPVYINCRGGLMYDKSFNFVIVLLGTKQEKRTCKTIFIFIYFFYPAFAKENNELNI